MLITRRNMFRTAAGAAILLPQALRAADPQRMGPITVTLPSNSGFHSLLTQHAPSLLSSATFISMAQSHAIISNIHPVIGVKALSFIWHQSGSSPTPSMMSVTPPGPSGSTTPRLMTAQFNVLGPGAVALLTPAGLILLPRASTRLSSDSLTQNIMFARSVIEGSNSTYSEPIVDALITDDWRLYGIDALGLKARVEISRNAEHDQGFSVFRAFALQRDYSSIQSQLRNMIISADPPTPSFRASLYWNARRNEAQRMLGFSEDELRVHALSLRNLRFTSITRASS